MHRFATRLFPITFLIATGFLSACKPEAPAPPPPTPAPAPTPIATPTPTPEPTPTPFVLDERSQVIVFCYHRFDDKPRDSLSISPKDFEAQMQALKDNGITVISMEDFLAWRRGEKNIPAKSALIGIDDGYISGYKTAWPILKKFGYPFTMYIYTDFVKGGKNAGGASMTWEQLAEMRDAGVDIGSHTLSHSPLNRKKGKSDAEYLEWLKAELGESKRILEEKLGIPIKTIAYPYGLHNEIVRAAAMEAGYEAAFTVYGQRLAHGADASMLGRYAIESTKPQIFQQAAGFGGIVEGAPATASSSGGSPAMAMPAAASMVTLPMQGETISDPRPEIKANLATLGKNIDPKSVQMRVSGFGPVPAEYDPATQLIHFQMHQQLREKTCYIVVSARVDGRKKEAGWSFNFERKLPTETAEAPAPAAGPTSDDMAGIPPMKPAE